MRQLLNDSGYTCEEYSYEDEPITSSQIVKLVAPQRQALTQEEVLELVKHDHLTEKDSST